MVLNVNKSPSDNPVSSGPYSKAYFIILRVDKQAERQSDPGLTAHRVDHIDDRQRPQGILDRHLLAGGQEIHVTRQTHIITQSTNLIIKQIR